MPLDHSVIGVEGEPHERSWTSKDTMLYALGVGAGQDPAADELRFVYESGLEPLPTMAVVLAYPGFWQREPQYGIAWKRVLHAEQSVRWHAPLPVEGRIRGETTIDKIVDKGASKGALLYASRKIIAVEDERLLATVRQVSFLRGDGGRGGTAAEADRPHVAPTRAADEIAIAQTRPEQALIYRLSGDDNPLHADPTVAVAAGHPRPILHGLCTYGVVGRLVLRLLCANIPTRLRRMDCRFTAPVFPGDSLTLLLWRQGAGRASFQVQVEARDRLVLDNGYLEFLEA